MEFLLPRAKPGDTDHSGNSALHEAVRNRRYQVICRLASKDPNPLYRQNKESKSPWCIAVETGDLEVLKLLLEAPNPDETVYPDSETSMEESNPDETGESELLSRETTSSDFGMSPAHVAVMYRKMGKPYFQAFAYSLTFLVTLFFILVSNGGGRIKFHEQSLV